jgi:CRISPR/Cas system CSM-associated protein Csm4 (group 5 of RAMP superfamily)
MSAADPAPPGPEPIPEPEQEPPIPPEEPPEPQPIESVAEAAPVEVPEQPAAVEPVPAGLQAHWLLSLFSPASADSVDWARGNYTVMARGGRIDSPAGSGELKKQVRMVAEGSVVYSSTALSGTAADVAPDGFAHPVFRAGFAVAIPLPEVR